MIRSANLNRMNLKWPNFLVAEEGGAVVGIGQVKAHGDGSREVASMAVVPAWQGKGIGSAIIKALIAGEGDRVLYLTCRREMRGYYERFGFRTIAKADYPPYFARLIRVVNAFALLARTEVLVMRRPG
jgi:N-acetylglutamate synthase-like GNAT family acetyltransferase